MPKSEPKAKELFDVLTEEAKKLVFEDKRFQECAVQIERDYRGGKYDVFSIRVMKEPEGRRGILSEPIYYER